MSVFEIDRFNKNIKDHVLVINKDDGVYRDITFQKPNSSAYHFNITTRPGYLIYTGDMGDFIFHREFDMFGFFRGNTINPYYWAEKIKAGEYKEYSPTKAKEALDQELKAWLEDTDFNQKQIAEEKEKINAINVDDYFDFVASIRDWSPIEGGIQLDDFWENNFKEYTYHYLWCCHAIVHVINLYDQHRLIEADNHAD